MVVKILFFALVTFIFFWGTSHAKSATSPIQLLPRTVVGGEFRSRYPLQTATEKFISNEGAGFASLYGTRNFRAVLNGVYYRGGANNVFHVPKRSNMNPLPTDGLENLCKEGFGHAVYLYDVNYETAPHSLKCTDFRGNENTINYLQISPLAYREEDLRKLHSLIYDHIRDPRLGPIYDHCWNGWHASGYVAATTLRQFCDFTAEQAVSYWNINTDGNSSDPGYEKIRVRIRAFTPLPGLSLTATEKAALCPKPDSLAFGGKASHKL